jgi:hypothetical protein
MPDGLADTLTGTRARVFARQQRVLRAVLSGTDLPAEFERLQLEVAHDAVVRKRAWCCAGAWPQMCRALGGRFFELFETYMRGDPYPPAGGSSVDGRLFAVFLQRRGLLPDVGRVQALAFDLRHRIRDGRATPTRGVTVRWVRLRRPPYLVIGLRAFGRPPRVVRIPLGRRRMRGSG